MSEVTQEKKRLKKKLSRWKGDFFFICKEIKIMFLTENRVYVESVDTIVLKFSMT